MLFWVLEVISFTPSPLWHLEGILFTPLPFCGLEDIFFTPPHFWHKLKSQKSFFNNINLKENSYIKEYPANPHLQISITYLYFIIDLLKSNQAFPSLSIPIPYPIIKIALLKTMCFPRSCGSISPPQLPKENLVFLGRVLCGNAGRACWKEESFRYWFLTAG